MHIPSYHISDAARRRHDPLVVLLRVPNLRRLVRPFQPLMWLLFLPPPYKLKVQPEPVSQAGPGYAFSFPKHSEQTNPPSNKLVSVGLVKIR